MIISYKDYVFQRPLTVVESDQPESFFQQVKLVLAVLRKSTTAYNYPLISGKSSIYIFTPF